MAAKNSTSSEYREIIDNIKKGQFASIYLLMGEEPYYIDLIVEAIEKHAVKEENKDFDQLVFYGAEADLDVVMASARQFPVMGDRQLVILKEAQTVQGQKSQLDRLAPYISQPNSRGVFVLAYKGDNLAATSAIMKAAAKSSGTVVFKSPKVKEYQLATPIKDYCRMRKVQIEEQAVLLLIEYIGNSLRKLFGEIDKLIVAAGSESKTITASLVADNIGISKEYNNFELTKALSLKDYPKTLRILDYFRKNPKNNPTVMTTTAMFTFFSRIVITHFLQDRSDASLMQNLQLKSPYAIREIRDGVSMYSPRQALSAISALRDFDCRSKGINSFQNEYALQRELVFKIFTCS